MLHLFVAIKTTVVHFCDLKPARARSVTRRKYIFKIWSNRLQLAILSEKINYIENNPFASIPRSHFQMEYFDLQITWLVVSKFLGAAFKCVTKNGQM